jgi:zinc transporter 1
MGHRHFQPSRKTRLRAVIAISVCFFVAEIYVGFYTRSIALVADAFHYVSATSQKECIGLTLFKLNDLISFIVALVAVQVTERKETPQDLTFGWARAQLLGSFLNGAFLIALGVSIFLQSIERFIFLQQVENPKLVLIIGSIGLTLNFISAIFLHEHDHGDGQGHGHGCDHSHSSHTDTDIEAPSVSSTHVVAPATDHHREHLHLSLSPPKHGMDFGMLGVLIHVLGDAINNIGVIITALVIWLTHSPSRFYADPAVSMFIAIMIVSTAIPLIRRSGKILLQSAPLGVMTADVKHDLESIPGILSVHGLHVWRLDQRKAFASAHVVVSDPDVESFTKTAKIMNECLYAYGIHSVTLQPELQNEGSSSDEESAVCAMARPELYRILRSL